MLEGCREQTQAKAAAPHDDTPTLERGVKGDEHGESEPKIPTCKAASVKYVYMYTMVRPRELEKRYGKGSKAQRDRVLQTCSECVCKRAGMRTTRYARVCASHYTTRCPAQALNI